MQANRAQAASCMFCLFSCDTKSKVFEQSREETKMSGVGESEYWKLHRTRLTSPLWRGFWFALAAILVLGGAESPAGAQAINIRHNVAAINQGKGNLCWAAATAMLLNWKIPGLHTMQTVATQGGPEFVTLYNNAMNNASPSEISLDQEKRLYAKMNMVVVSGISPTISGWQNLLYNKGPLHVTIKPNGSGGMLHGILITGLVGDGTAGGTEIFYNDPATGTQVKKKVVDFVALYDGAANWTNNIIHNP